MSLLSDMASLPIIILIIVSSVFFLLVLFPSPLSWQVQMEGMELFIWGLVCICCVCVCLEEVYEVNNSLSLSLSLSVPFQSRWSQKRLWCYEYANKISGGPSLCGLYSSDKSLLYQSHASHGHLNDLVHFLPIFMLVLILLLLNLTLVSFCIGSLVIGKNWELPS